MESKPATQPFCVAKIVGECVPNYFSNEMEMELQHDYNRLNETGHRDVNSAVQYCRMRWGTPYFA